MWQVPVDLIPQCSHKSCQVAAITLLWEFMASPIGGNLRIVYIHTRPLVEDRQRLYILYSHTDIYVRTAHERLGVLPARQEFVYSTKGSQPFIRDHWLSDCTMVAGPQILHLHA